MIAAYRQQRTRACTGAPWSQEELALASGTSQAHISRIESNQKHPQYSTIVRLCEALNLPAAKRRYLLALAGYAIEPPLPDRSEVEALLAELAPVVDGYRYPALLMDVGERVWHVNSLVAEMWGPCLGGSTHAHCQASIRGKRSLEFLFHPEFRPVWGEYLQNAGPVMDRHASLFWRAYHLRPDEKQMNDALASLKRNGEFLQRWRDLEQGENKIVFLEHDWLPLKHPRFGKLLFNIWRTTVAADERFILAHFPPADDATQRTLRRILRR